MDSLDEAKMYIFHQFNLMYGREKDPNKTQLQFQDIDKLFACSFRSLQVNSQIVFSNKK